MKPFLKFGKAANAVCAGLLALGTTLTLSNCNHAEAPVTPRDEKAVPGPTEGSLGNAPLAPVTIHEATAPTDASSKPLSKTSGYTTVLNFGDATACNWNPTICSSTFVFWPGYIQSAGGSDWGYVWMSNGLWQGPLGYGEPVSESSHHYHIYKLGQTPTLPDDQLAWAMYGNWWMWVGMKRGSARVNFDLLEIKVKGTVPVQIYYLDANGGGWHWSSIAPGWWNLGALNIQEAYISAASGGQYDLFKVDDIVVKAR